MAVKGKFYVAEVTLTAYQDTGGRVVMQPVTRGEENKDWAKWTPSGKIELTVTNEDAFKEFSSRVGKEFYATFEPVDEPVD